MGVVQKAFIVMICMNLFLYFYLPSDWSLGQSGIIGNFADLSGQTLNIDGTGLNENMPNSLSQDTAVVGTGSLSLVSTFRMVWGFVQFILTLFAAPLIVALIIPDIPLVVQAFLIIPNLVVLAFGTISFIRGADW